MSPVPESSTRLATRALLAACAARTEDPGWPHLVDRLRRHVRGGVLGVLARGPGRSDPELVEELVQEVWCRLLERDRRVLRLCGRDADGAVCRYVRRVASTVTVDVLRIAGAAKRRPVGLERLEEAGSDAAVADLRWSPERRLLARERIVALLRLCRELLGPKAHPDRLRIVRLAWIEGCTTNEISLRVGGRWGARAIDSFLSRLRQKLLARGAAPALRAGDRSSRVRRRR